MPQVDFYILKNGEPNAADLVACRLVEKAFNQKHAVYLHVADHTHAQRLDDFLWTFKDTSFIPHGLCPNVSSEIKIQIGYGEPPAERDLLINLAPDIPAFFNTFNRILEIIPKSSPFVEQGRERFRLYKAQNCELNTHNI